MFSQAWREIDEEKQSEVVRQALASLQSDERFLVIEALCTANGTAFPQVSRRTTSQLIPDIVAALPRMADSAVQLLMERRYQGAMGVAGDFSFDFAADDPFCKQSEPALRRVDDFVAKHGRAEALLGCAYLASFGPDRERSTVRLLLQRLRSTPEGTRLSPTMQECVPPVDLAPDVAAENGAQPGESAGSGSAHVESVKPTTSDPAAATLLVDASERRPTEFQLSMDWAYPRQREDELDRVIIRAIIATQHGELGALPHDAIDRLVATILSLSTSRFESYFYVGFLDALRKRPYALPASATNAARRAWYISGYFSGAKRTLGTEEFLSAVELLSDAEIEALCDPADPGAVRRLAPIVVHAAVQSGDVKVVERWVSRGGPCDEQSTRRATALALLEPAEDRELNLSLCNSLTHLFMVRRRTEEIDEIDPDEAELLLAVIGIMRESGAVNSAIDLFDMTSGSWGRQAQHFHAARFLTIEGLWTTSALVPGDRASLESLAARLNSAEAIEQFGDEASLRLIGLLAVALADCDAGLPSKAETTQALLQGAGDVRRSLRLHAGRRSRYLSLKATELENAVAVLSGLLALVSVSEVHAEESVQLLEEWLAAGRALPPTLVKLALENAALMNCRNLPGFFVQVVGRYGAQVLDFAALADLAHNFESHGALSALLSDPKIPLTPEQRWTLSRSMGRSAALGGRNPDVAMECLERMQDLVEREPTLLGRALIDELDDQSWMSVISEDERDSIATRVADLLGEYGTVAERLIRQLQRAVWDDRIVVAMDLLEVIDAHGLGVLVTNELRERIKTQEHAASRLAHGARTGLPVRILFVGGNEVQARWDRDIEAWLTQEYPGTGVTWIHPGWSSNWNKPLADVAGAMQRHQAVVLMKFVRTIFGEKVRRMASENHRPWIPCTGHGLSSVKRAIGHAIAVARGKQ
jgi:hypothetical protein